MKQMWTDEMLLMQAEADFLSAADPEKKDDKEFQAQIIQESIAASLLVIARNSASVGFDNVSDGEPHLPPANTTREIRTA